MTSVKTPEGSLSTCNVACNIDPRMDFNDDVLLIERHDSERSEPTLILQAPSTREDILTVLGDTKDKKYPIWRSGSDNVYTLCTAFFDLQAETVEVIFDNPKKDLSGYSQQNRSIMALRYGATESPL